MHVALVQSLFTVHICLFLSPVLTEVDKSMAVTGRGRGAGVGSEGGGGKWRAR